MNARHRFPILALLTICIGLPCAPLIAGQQSKPKPQAPVVSDEPPFDPLGAEKNIEVGMYYMKKGNYDAAIERFKAATLSKPNFARPHRLIGEALEKKGEKAEAIESYKKYLEIVPNRSEERRVGKECRL